MPDALAECDDDGIRSGSAISQPRAVHATLNFPVLEPRPTTDQLKLYATTRMHAVTAPVTPATSVSASRQERLAARQDGVYTTVTRPDAGVFFARDGTATTRSHGSRIRRSMW
jgi:hypothetical protein